jgi:cell division protein FtsQ
VSETPLRSRGPDSGTETRFLRGRAAGKTPMPLRGKRSRAQTPVEAPLRAGHTPGQVPLYRRRAVKPGRKRRFRALRWLRPLSIAILIVAAVAGTAAWLATSPRFRVTVVEVRGQDPALRAWVESRVAGFVGERLLLLSLARVTAAVGEHPWIDTVEVSRVLPGRLLVEIHERRPAAVVEVPESEGRRELVYADAEGRPIAPVEEPGPGAPDPEVLGRLLRVTGGTEDAYGVPEALEIQRELSRARPAWGDGVTRVEVLGETDFRLHTAALPFPLVMRAGEVELEIRRLGRLLPWLVERWGEPQAVDLRFARRIVMERVVEDRSDRSPDRGA